MLGIPRKIKVFKISGFFRRAVEKKFHRFDDVFKSGSELQGSGNRSKKSVSWGKRFEELAFSHIMRLY